MRCLAALGVAILITGSCLFAQQIPAGTVVPVMMSVTVDSAKAHVGQPITGKVMETVPLAVGEQIPAGARVYGRVSQVISGDGVSPATLAISFDRVVANGREVPVKVSL